jgi:peptidyl-prolyl cis-trans isomerase A (cyclophilin A)
MGVASVAWAQAPAAAPAADAAAKVREDGLYATLQTSNGDIVVKFFEKESPITVKNFVDLAMGRKSWKHPKTGVMSRKPLYDGLTFHRVIPNFMIQGGDPLGNGEGGTAVIKDEFDPSLKFDTPGRLAMANAGPGTGSCQFFITEIPTPHLNGGHTIFGQAIEGMDVVKAIARVPAGANNKPRTPVVMKKVVVERWEAGKPVPVYAAAKPAATKAPAKAAPKTAPATPGKAAPPAKPASSAAKK